MPIGHTIENKFCYLNSPPKLFETLYRGYQLIVGIFIIKKLIWFVYKINKSENGFIRSVLLIFLIYWSNHTKYVHNILIKTNLLPSEGNYLQELIPYDLHNYQYYVTISWSYDSKLVINAQTFIFLFSKCR